MCEESEDYWRRLLKLFPSSRAPPISLFSCSKYDVTTISAKTPVLHVEPFAVCAVKEIQGLYLVLNCACHCGFKIFCHATSEQLQPLTCRVPPLHKGSPFKNKTEFETRIKMLLSKSDFEVNFQINPKYAVGSMVFYWGFEQEWKPMVVQELTGNIINLVPREDGVEDEAMLEETGEDTDLWLNQDSWRLSEQGNFPFSDTFPSLQVGNGLECIDPQTQRTIWSVEVVKVNSSDSSLLLRAADGHVFCVDQNSHLLLPYGFCKKHGITLNGLNKVSHKFTKGHRVTAEQLPQHCNVQNQFHVFDVLECADCTYSYWIGAASVVQVAHRLLRIRFDGWDSTFDLWTDCRSPDIFPIGWCQAIGYPLHLESQQMAEKQNHQERTASSDSSDSDMSTS